MGLINQNIAQGSLWLFLLLIIWVLPWKGYALWTASRLGHKKWFIILIVLNTFAILDIFYIFYVAKRSLKDFFKAFKSKI